MTKPAERLRKIDADYDLARGVHVEIRDTAALLDECERVLARIAHVAPLLAHDLVGRCDAGKVGAVSSFGEDAAATLAKLRGEA